MAARKAREETEAIEPGGTIGSDAGRGGGKVAVVKKYANRRLYNTASSSYVTLDELCQMVREGHEFLVYDAKTGDDITRSVLTQIILEEDAKGRNLMPIGFLRQLIGLYDDNLNTVVPRYLEVSMENFARHQGQMREYMEETVGRFFPLKQLDAMKPFEEMARQNMALFQKAASIFTPPQGEPVEQKVQATAQEVAAEAAALSHQVETLRTEMERLRQQMVSLQTLEQPVKKA